MLYFYLKKVLFLLEEIPSNRKGWTFDVKRGKCISRPFHEAACADTKNKFIEHSECKKGMSYPLFM